MCDVMSFPATVDEFMEQYKIVDREEVYTNGAEMVPIFRMKQWFEHEALGKDINVPGKSALDHIHNVVAEREYQRGYKTAKEEYDHKLTVIKNTIKDYWYIKGKEDGKEDAAKWIPVSDGLPEEKINPNTHDFEEVLCSTTFGDVRAYKFGKPFGWEKPHFWHGGGMMDEYVLAWVEKPEPWKGVRYGTFI
jgi:hypothetical protein